MKPSLTPCCVPHFDRTFECDSLSKPVTRMLLCYLSEARKIISRRLMCYQLTFYILLCFYLCVPKIHDQFLFFNRSNMKDLNYSVFMRLPKYLNLSLAVLGELQMSLGSSLSTLTHVDYPNSFLSQFELILFRLFCHSFKIYQSCIYVFLC